MFIVHAVRTLGRHDSERCRSSSAQGDGGLLYKFICCLASATHFLYANHIVVLAEVVCICLQFGYDTHCLSCTCRWWHLGENLSNLNQKKLWKRCCIFPCSCWCYVEVLIVQIRLRWFCWRRWCFDRDGFKHLQVETREEQNKKWEETRAGRVDSWRNWTNGKRTGCVGLLSNSFHFVFSHLSSWIFHIWWQGSHVHKASKNTKRGQHSTGAEIAWLRVFLLTTFRLLRRPLPSTNLIWAILAVLCAEKSFETLEPAKNPNLLVDDRHLFQHFFAINFKTFPWIFSTSS